MPLYIVTKGPLSKDTPVKAILSDAWRPHNATYHALDILGGGYNTRFWVYNFNEELGRDKGREFVVTIEPRRHA